MHGIACQYGQCNQPRNGAQQHDHIQPPHTGNSGRAGINHRQARSTGACM